MDSPVQIVPVTEVATTFLDTGPSVSRLGKARGPESKRSS